MARSFADLSARLAHVAPSLAHNSRNKVESIGPTAADQCRMVESILRMRRLRTKFFADTLFADPAWDILLDLYLAELQQRRVTVSSLCVGANVPQTTALRWIKMMTDEGLLQRRDDLTDARKKMVELTPEASAQMHGFLRSIYSIMSAAS